MSALSAAKNRYTRKIIDAGGALIEANIAPFYHLSRKIYNKYK
jgi:hypothetical protein